MSSNRSFMPVRIGQCCSKITSDCHVRCRLRYFRAVVRNNKREIRRKYIQLVHPGKGHLSLFVKNVKYENFLPVVSVLIEPDMSVGDAGGSWQSVQLCVSEINPCLSVEEQSEKIDQVFIAARRLYQFFIKNKTALLAIRKFK